MVLGACRYKISEGGEGFLIDLCEADRLEKPLGKNRLCYTTATRTSIHSHSSIALQALHRRQESRNRIYPNINENFNINTYLPLDCDDAFIFPTPDPRKLLFHSNGNGDPQLLPADLFRDADSRPESVQAQDFDSSLRIARVAIAKLTQALFLINPSAFLPFDRTGRSLGISSSAKGRKLDTVRRGTTEVPLCLSRL